MVFFYSISFIIVVFCVLGLFGNVNIIWATYRKPQLQKKHGLLLANLAGYHLICISWQWVNVFYSVKHRIPRQNECFKLILPYIFAISAQAIMYVVIVGDLLAAVLVPLRHHFFQPFQYVVVLSIPVWIYSTAVPVWGALSVEEKEITFCNPPLALNGSASRFWIGTNLSIIVLVLVLHFSVWVILKRKGEEQLQILLYCLPTETSRRTRFSQSDGNQLSFRSLLQARKSSSVPHVTRGEHRPCMAIRSA
ncbi:hypothetical protein GCK32_006263 [Trichostrongylus colubriformis]|uniref:G-protein coupled receptors family 1 profile domain-containing protein n=1 Tax=Trichostrongylus colubriformis TaxID=6319 RepID=A0AAN8FN61_TRICO